MCGIHVDYTSAEEKKHARPEGDEVVDEEMEDWSITLRLVVKFYNVFSSSLSCFLQVPSLCYVGT